MRRPSGKQKTLLLLYSQQECTKSEPDLSLSLKTMWETSLSLLKDSSLTSYVQKMTLRYSGFKAKNFLVPNFLKMTLGVPTLLNKRFLGPFCYFLDVELLEFAEKFQEWKNYAKKQFLGVFLRNIFVLTD